MSRYSLYTHSLILKLASLYEVANSSAMDMKPLLVEEMLTELHRGNFSPAPPDIPISNLSPGTHVNLISDPDRVVNPSDEVDGKTIDAAPEVPDKEKHKKSEGDLTKYFNTML